MFKHIKNLCLKSLILLNTIIDDMDSLINVILCNEKIGMYSVHLKILVLLKFQYKF